MLSKRFNSIHVLFLINIFGFASIFWMGEQFLTKGQKESNAPAATCPVFRWIQSDTLNPTQVQSSANAHVASTWTELKRIKEKRLKEQKKWAMYWCVLCLWELARLLIFTSLVCMHMCICYGNMIHISLVGVGELSSPAKNKIHNFS